MTSSPAAEVAQATPSAPPRSTNLWRLAFLVVASASAIAVTTRELVARKGIAGGLGAALVAALVAGLAIALAGGVTGPPAYRNATVAMHRVLLLVVAIVAWIMGAAWGFRPLRDRAESWRQATELLSTRVELERATEGRYPPSLAPALLPASLAALGDAVSYETDAAGATCTIEVALPWGLIAERFGSYRSTDHRWEWRFDD